MHRGELDNANMQTANDNNQNSGSLVYTHRRCGVEKKTDRRQQSNWLPVVATQ